ncbi:MAG TPA: hypothetical protein VIS29_00220, partial [Streptomyces sp.]
MSGGAPWPPRVRPRRTGVAGCVTVAGRISGLLAGYACAVLPALMARMPLLDHTVGSDRLARRHARGG